MGKVFSPESLTAGNVPGPDAHWAATDELLERFHDENRKNGICGAVYGSVALGHANIRSDVDMLGIIPEGADEFRIAARVAGHISQVEAKWKVPIEANVITDQDIVSRRHPITEDPLICEHLFQAAGNSTHTFGEPEIYLLPLITFNTAKDQLDAAADISRLYTGIKRREFFSSLTSNHGPANLYGLQRAFELPSALGHKLLRLHELAGWAAVNDAPHNPSMDRRLYARQPLAEGMVRMLEDSGQTATPAQWLMRRDTEYTDLLQSTLQGQTSISEYSKWLASVQQPAILQALHLATIASRLVRRLPG